MSRPEEVAEAYARAAASAVKALSADLPARALASVSMALAEQIDLAAEMTGTEQQAGATRRALLALARACLKEAEEARAAAMDRVMEEALSRFEPR